MRGLGPPRMLLLHHHHHCHPPLAIAMAMATTPPPLHLLLPPPAPRFPRFLRFSSSLPNPNPHPLPAIASSSALPPPKVPLVCPGCGVFLQNKSRLAPGFFQQPRRLVEGREQVDQQEELDELEVEEEEEEDDSGEEESEKKRKNVASGWTFIQLEGKGGKRLDANDVGFGPAGPEYGRGRSDDGGWNQVGGHNLDVKSDRRDKEKSKDKQTEVEKLLVCVRCHELRNYGKVRNEEAENLLPDFDFERTVGTRLTKTQATRTIVVMVVDCADFDGSFPRRVASLLSEVDEKDGGAWKENKSGNVPRLVLVANKIDLLPKQISPMRLDHWVRRRAKEGGAPRLSALFLVSCMKSWGVKAVAQAIKEMAGPRGEVWVVGAQNAGKSSLINALSKVEEGAKLTQLTEAPVPGTTLGILRLDGILPAKVKMFDTPGLLHPHQMTVRLTREEQKIVQVRKELKPRTYRVKVDDTIHVGGLVRLDVKEISASSIYITIWGSPLLTCHLGKTQKATEIFEKHVGDKLQPPFNKERLEELGPRVRTPVSITGDSWDKSSVDIAVAGVGWFGIGINGTADIDVWTYDGVAITTRKALVPDMALTFEKAGFTAVKGGTAKVK